MVGGAPVNIWCSDNGRVLDFVISVKQRRVMNFTLADVPFKFLCSLVLVSSVVQFVNFGSRFVRSPMKVL